MDLFLNISLAVFGLASALAGFGGESWRKGRERLARRVTVRGWLALTCLLVSFFIVVVKEVRADRAIQEAERENEEQRAEISDLRRQLNESTIEQAKSAARIETLTGETRDLVTGGSSYVWVLVAPAPAQDNPMFFLTAVQGGDDVPAFDVNIRFERTGRCDGFEKWTMGRVMATGINDPRQAYLPAVTPAMLHPIPVRLQPTCDEAYYLAYIHTRNRVMFQQTLLRKSAGSWRIETRLVDLYSGATLHTLPIDATGVAWPEKPKLVSTLPHVLEKLKQDPLLPGENP